MGSTLLTRLHTSSLHTQLHMGWATSAGGGLGKQRPSSDSAVLPPPPRAICSILRTWLDKYPEDFCQSVDLACLNQLMAYVLLNMPCSELAVPVDLLLTQLEDRKSSEVEPKSEEALGKCPSGCEEGVSSSGKRKQFRVPRTQGPVSQPT